MVRQSFQLLRAMLVAAAVLLGGRLTAGENGGGYWYGSYRYAYNPGYYARRYPAPRPGYDSYYHEWGYGRGYKMAPGMSGALYLRYSAPVRSPANQRIGK